MKRSLSLRVNGKKHTLRVFPMTRLLDVLRQALRLTGTKEGCGEGECGACSVLVDGELVNSCLIPVAQVAERNITTIEGVAHPSKLHRMQRAFLECGGAQCGICTPGMIMAAIAYQSSGGKKNRGSIRAWLAGQLCRCTGYEQILDSVEAAIGITR